jgi:hypothetical protein
MWLHVNLQHFKLLGKGLSLGMPLSKLVNTHGMTQRFVLGFKRSISSKHNGYPTKKKLGPRKGKDIVSGKEHRLQHWKFKTPIKTKFANKIVMFQETLEYQNAIDLCYRRQETHELQAHVPNVQTWAICKIICETIFHVVEQCIINQTQQY